MRKSSARYNVAPRYTCGSPASVDKATATLVASEERRAYEAALTGVYGDADKTKAERLGLRGIVEYREEKGSGKNHGWHVEDLCTGEMLFRLTNEALLKQGWRSFGTLSTYEQGLARELPIIDPEKKFYKIAFGSRVIVEAYEARVVERPEEMRS
jgi:hypothetical protein